MPVLMVLLVVLPLAAVLVCVRAPHPVAAAVTVIAGVASFVLAIALVPFTAGRTITGLHYLRADALSVIFLLSTCFLYAVVAIYSVGYMADEQRAVQFATTERRAIFARYSSQFYLGLNAFAWAMICAPLVNDLALLWIAVEITTVVSALLVALDNTEGATEAAWKYVLIASSGLGIALLATIFMYYAGAHVL
ncbi:MAG: NADH dehydrogenase FAD-containing subunit, partial [Mycobacterium sp.]|nr:NADH dehydrogenase FAD-containing subunit [Mycobacterium sp.]